MPDEILLDEARYGKAFKGNFRYEITRPGSAGFLFHPGTTLPMPDGPYQAELPISYSEGLASAEGRMPVRLLGETPVPPSKAEWAKAYERLQKSIAYFGIGNDPDLRK